MPFLLSKYHLYAHNNNKNFNDMQILIAFQYRKDMNKYIRVYISVLFNSLFVWFLILLIPLYSNSLKQRDIVLKIATHKHLTLAFSCERSVGCFDVFGYQFISLHFYLPSFVWICCFVSMVFLSQMETDFLFSVPLQFYDKLANVHVYRG